MITVTNAHLSSHARMFVLLAGIVLFGLAALLLLCPSTVLADAGGFPTATLTITPTVTPISIIVAPGLGTQPSLDPSLPKPYPGIQSVNEALVVEDTQPTATPSANSGGLLRNITCMVVSALVLAVLVFFYFRFRRGSHGSQ